MRVGAAALAGGIFGVLGTLCFFLAFGSDYWLVASDDCGPYTWPTATTLAGANETEVGQTQVCTQLNANLVDPCLIWSLTSVGSKHRKVAAEYYFCTVTSQPQKHPRGTRSDALCTVVCKLCHYRIFKDALK